MYLINSRNFTHTYLNSTDGGILRLRGDRPFSVFFQNASLKKTYMCFILQTLLCAVVSFMALLAFPAARAEAAQTAAGERCRTFSGSVYDLRTLDPLAGAVVSVRTAGGDNFEARTGEDGKYSLYDIPAGTCTVKVSKDGYISDSVRLHLKKSYERYDVSIESERDYERKNSPEYDRNINRYAGEGEEGGENYSGGGSLGVTLAPAFSPKDNFKGNSGFYELPDCSAMPYGAYRLSYGVQRSKRLSSPATPYTESNYSTAVGYGLAENFEASVFAFQHFGTPRSIFIPATATTAAREVPPFYADRTGVSLKYAGKYNYKDAGMKFPYALLYTHYNDGSDEVAVPVEFPSQFSGKFYFIPTYISRLGGNVHFNFAYYKPLFIDHRKLSYAMEFVQNDRHRWNVINAGLRLEFRNDSAANLFLLSDSEKKRLSVGVSGTMLFK